MRDSVWLVLVLGGGIDADKSRGRAVGSFLVSYSLLYRSSACCEREVMRPVSVSEITENLASVKDTANTAC